MEEKIAQLKQEAAETAASVQPDATGWQLPVPVFVAAPIATAALLLLIFIIRALMSLSGRKRSRKNDNEHKQEDIK